MQNLIQYYEHCKYTYKQFPYSNGQRLGAEVYQYSGAGKRLNLRAVTVQTAGILLTRT